MFVKLYFIFKVVFNFGIIGILLFFFIFVLLLDFNIFVLINVKDWLNLNFLIFCLVLNLIFIFLVFFIFLYFYLFIVGLVIFELIKVILLVVFVKKNDVLIEELKI